MAPTTSPDRLTGRTRIITIVSIVAVGLAGLFAIGANVGILTRTGDSKVGNVSAGDLIPADTRVVDVYVDGSGHPLTSTTSTPAAATTPRAQPQAGHDDDRGSDDHGGDDHDYEGGDFDD